MITLEYMLVHGKRHSKVTRIKMTADMQQHINVIDEMYSAGLGQKNNIAKEIHEKCTSLVLNENLSKEELEEEIYYLHENDPSEEIIELIEEMQIVSLYKSVEIAIKRMFLISELISTKNLDGNFNFIELKKFWEKQGRNIEHFEGFVAYDELRCINNCIKHSGKVNKHLSKYPNWTLNDRVSGCSKSYDRLKQDVHKFVLSFGAALTVKVA